MFEKIKYYIKTTSARRAMYAAEYNELARRACGAQRDMDCAYDALVGDVPVDRSFYAVHACMKVMEIPQVSLADIFTSYPCSSVVLRDQCWYYQPLRPCGQRACKYHAKNQDYFVKRDIYRAACAVRDSYWPNLYAKIK